MFLFPYENIKKDSKVVIYGAGNMGTDYILQVLRTQYCNIVFALDRAAEEKVGFPVPVYKPDYMKSVEASEYDFVLVALQDVNHSVAIKELLLAYGVEESKIVQAQEVGLNCAGFFPKPEVVTTDSNPEVLRLAFYAYGGMGDTLIATALIKAVRKIVDYPLVIDYYCNCPAVYQNFPFIDHVYKLNQFSDSYDYDFSAFVFRNINFKKINLEKIRRISKPLYDWCMDALTTNEKICDNFRDDCRYSMYTEMKGKNRLEQHNINDILPYDRNTPVYMAWEVSVYEKLSRFGLEGKRYVTICTGIENCNTMRNPKLWDIEKYNAVVRMIKERYPDLLVVNVGQNYNFGKVEGVDIDIVGQTTLDDIKVILKHSLLHIGVEGGLVHLNHFVYGKSCCLYGPTSMSFFSYPENISIQSGYPKLCRNGCEGIVFNWMSYGCFLGEEPLCMKALTPEMVFESMKEYLDTLPEWSYQVEELIPLEQDGLEAVLENMSVGGTVAVIHRMNDAVVRVLREKAVSLVVFDRNMGDEENPKGNEYIRSSERNGWNAEYGNIYNIPEQSNVFDVVVNGSLEQEEQKDYALKELLRVVRPGGCLVLLCSDTEKLCRLCVSNEITISAQHVQKGACIVKIVKK